MASCHVDFEGRYRLRIQHEDGTETDTGWFKNLITNGGMDGFGQGFGTNTNPNLYSQLIGWAGVGTGNTPPAFTDTQLTSPLGPVQICSTGGGGSWASSSYVAGPPAYWSGICNYTWSQGAVVGNIAEVGVGNNFNSTGNFLLFSHALIVDSSGNPTTLTVLSTDTLFLSYELRMYLNLTDSSYSVVINGTSYSGTQRMANVSSVGFQPFEIGYSPGSSLASQIYYCYGTGVIGAVTSQPSGLSQRSGNEGATVTVIAPYTPGSYTIGWTIAVPANKYPSATILSMLFATTLGQWQFSLSPSLSYLSTQSFSNVISVSWARFTP